MPHHEKRPVKEWRAPEDNYGRNATDKGGGVVKSYPISRPEGHGWNKKGFNWPGNEPEDNRVKGD